MSVVSVAAVMPDLLDRRPAAHDTAGSRATPADPGRGIRRLGELCLGIEARYQDPGGPITAEVEIPEGGAEGMMVTEGGRFGGYGLFLSKGEFGVGRGKVVFLYNLLDLKRTAWEGPELGVGKHTIVFDFKPDGAGLGKGGTGVLSVDGKEVARNSLDHTTPITFPEDETFDVGLDTRTPLALVEYRYDAPFKFTGKLNQLTIALGPGQ